MCRKLLSRQQEDEFPTESSFIFVCKTSVQRTQGKFLKLFRYTHISKRRDFPWLLRRIFI